MLPTPSRTSLAQAEVAVASSLAGATRGLGFRAYKGLGFRADKSLGFSVRADKGLGFRA